MYYVYVLKSLKKDWVYVGYSTDLKSRLETHKKAKVKSTKNYLPLELVFYEAYKSRGDARRREKYFKTTGGKRSLRLILKESLK